MARFGSSAFELRGVKVGRRGAARLAVDIIMLMQRLSDAVSLCSGARKTTPANSMQRVSEQTPIGESGDAMLSDAERTDARRFMGYPVFGTGPGGNLGDRFYQAFGLVEYRLGALSDAELVVTRRYLGTLQVLEMAIPGVAAGLDTESAAGWRRNPAELAERGRLFDDWRRRLCVFLGVPPGPGLQAGSSSVALVV